MKMKNHLMPCILYTVLIWSCSQAPSDGEADSSMSSSILTALTTIIPAPATVTADGGFYSLTADTAVIAGASQPEVLSIANYLQQALTTPTGYALPVVTEAAHSNGHISLFTNPALSNLGQEGYQITVNSQGIALTACQPEGLFRAVQTLRQMLPASTMQSALQSGPFQVENCRITDYPRFVWRGAMLDVARHFFSVGDVKRYIDLLALYKINRFHMHLSDDQGWRIMINSWSNLALIGGSKAVGNDPGGFYTQEEYSEIAEYARSNYMILIPEIDMPGHVNAILASYPELNTNGVAPALYTGTSVGFSSLALKQSNTYEFLDDVLGELAAITPGPYIHIGGDEAKSTLLSDYTPFIARIESNVQKYGKKMIGWEEIAQAPISSQSVAQHWWTGSYAVQAVAKGMKVICSPASKAYIDMKYNRNCPYGHQWAGYVEIDQAYNWNPGALVSGLPESSILGVEAPMWTEYIKTIDQIEYMAFPRIPCYAEIGWSPQSARDYQAFARRLAFHEEKFKALSINYYKSTKVPWF